MMVLISIEDGFFKEPAMQLKSLRMFLAVCDSGSFGAAAQQLYTVQSNVTAHVKKLEDEAGVQLLERSAPVHATPAGRLLERYARRMLADHDESLALLQGSARAAGSLRIGSMETTAALRLPPLLARLHQGQPGLDLELRTATTAELLADLLAGRLDCAFVSGMPPQPRLQGWKVFEEELVLVTAFALPQFPDAAQLSATPFLAFRQGCSYRQRIELLLAASGVAARIMEMGSLDAILRRAHHGPARRTGPGSRACGNLVRRPRAPGLVACAACLRGGAGDRGRGYGCWIRRLGAGRFMRATATPAGTAWPRPHALSPRPRCRPGPRWCAPP
jgi:DNA-binding transcriptional LysR family regulator